MWNNMHRGKKNQWGHRCLKAFSQSKLSVGIHTVTYIKMSIVQVYIICTCEVNPTYLLLNLIFQHVMIICDRICKNRTNGAIQIFSIKHWNTLGKIAFFERICQLFYPPCSWWRKGPMVKPGYHRICPSKRRSKIFVWLQCTQGIVSYGHLFTWCRSSHSRSMFLHGFWLCLWWCRAVEGINYPVIHSAVHGEHDGEKFKSLPYSIHKLHLF